MKTNFWNIINRMNFQNVKYKRTLNLEIQELEAKYQKEFEEFKTKYDTSLEEKLKVKNYSDFIIYA